MQAIHLVKRLMTVDPQYRLSAEQALKHSFFTQEETGGQLSAAKDSLKRFNAKRKLKESVGGVIASLRLSKLQGSMRSSGGFDG